MALTAVNARFPEFPFSQERVKPNFLRWRNSHPAMTTCIATAASTNSRPLETIVFIKVIPENILNLKVPRASVHERGPLRLDGSRRPRAQDHEQALKTNLSSEG